MRYLVAALNANNLNPKTLSQVGCITSVTVDASQLDSALTYFFRTYGEGTTYGCRVLYVPLASTTEAKLETPPIRREPFKF